jgi:hypothetical protein
MAFTICFGIQPGLQEIRKLKECYTPKYELTFLWQKHPFEVIA